VSAEETSQARESKKTEPISHEDLVAGAEQAVENEQAARESGEESPSTTTIDVRSASTGRTVLTARFRAGVVGLIRPRS
jgi:hypothetical protein